MHSKHNKGGNGIILYRSASNSFLFLFDKDPTKILLVKSHELERKESKRKVNTFVNFEVNCLNKKMKRLAV